MLCLGRIHQHPDSNEAWKNRIAKVKSEKSYRDYDGINGEPTEFEWNIFPGFTSLQLCGKVTDLLSKLGGTPETFTGRILFMSMFNDISCDGKGNEEEMCGKFHSRLHTCKVVWYWTVVIYWSRLRKEVVFYGREHPTRNLGSYRGQDAVGIQQLHCPG